MKNRFNIVEQFVPAMPRRQRKKNAAAGGGSTVVVEGSGGDGSISDPNSHTHTNLPLLESLADQDGYLTRKEVNPDTAEDADPFVFTKVKAGFADKSGDSEKWNGNPFADFLDQPVRRDDAVEHKSVTVSESVTSKDFRKGDFSGSGFALYKDANGNAVAEVDILKARKEAVFNTAVINQVTFQVGATVFSNGGCEIARVEELDDVYRCYYDTKEGRRFCGLVVDDQVRCQRYDATQNRIVKYYWRLVVAVGEDYVDLSKTDVDGTGVPESGDEIAQFGHRTDKTRQGATIIDPKDGSSVVVYSEINSYSLEKKNFVGLGTNPQTGRPYLYCYGDFFLGDRELKNQFLTFQIPEGQTVPQLIGELNIKLGAGSSGLNNLTEWAEKQQQIDDAANAQFSSINLIDGSESVTVISTGSNFQFNALDIEGGVQPGEILSLSVDSIEQTAGNTADGYAVVVYDASITKQLCQRLFLTQASKSCQLIMNGDFEATAAKLLLYAGVNGATANNTVRYGKVMLTRGNKASLSWAPSVNDQKQAAIDGVHVGGVNHYSSSTNISIYETDSLQIENKTSNGFSYRSQSSRYTIRLDHVITNNGWWTAGFKIISSKDTRIYVDICDENKQMIHITGGEVTKVEISANIGNFDSVVYNFVDISYEEGAEEEVFVDISDLMIEEGNKATSWRKSPADEQTEINKIQQSISDLDYLKGVFPNAMLDVNGVVLAQLLGVKSSTAADAAVVAGIYGGSDETLNNAGFKDPTHGILMMFAGATNVQSAANAKTRVYGDGSIFTQMLYANGGEIGGFAISNYSLQAEDFTNNVASRLYMSANLLQYSGEATVFEKHTVAVNIGTNTVPGVSALKCPVFIKTTTSYLGAVASGIYIDAQNTLGTFDDTNAQYGSHAMMIAHGDICGFRLRTRRVKANTQLSNYDNIILCVQGSGQYTLTLPADPDDGHVIMTKSVGGSYALQVGASGQYINNGRSNRDTVWSIGIDSPIVMLIWDKVNRIWHGGYTNTR